MATRSSTALPSQPTDAAPDRTRTTLILGAGALVSGALVWFAVGQPLLVLAIAAGLVAFGTLLYLFRTFYPPSAEAELAQPDWSVTAAAIEQPGESIAITDRAGRLACANAGFIALFGPSAAPPRLDVGGDATQKLADASRDAWRLGTGSVEIETGDGHRYAVITTRIGRGEDHLIWRFAPVLESDLASDAVRLLSSRMGRVFGNADVLAAVVGPEGRIRAANSALALRATGQAEANIAGRDFVSFLRTDEQDRILFEREGRQGRPLRVLHIPLLDPGLPGDPAEAAALIALIDQGGGASDRAAAGLAQVEALLALLPVGLAMADRDGRFLFANPAFTRVCGVEGKGLPPYPADLVVREDKGALSDAVRRYATGQARSGGLAVRLRNQAEEPVSIGISGVRGLGEAVVLISLKDSSEETRLKREVAQATKMQAVGQLAGGVAHDFNNVLTAIIGICDFMLMRHSPGDSDYDDIQQIRSNSNRAASLTRQLLAFSRQQTLRPQVLQLPDIVSNTSQMLKRLLGETVRLELSHERDIGPVRADPTQIEQVIVNLAVNARDAMLEKEGKGVLTISTRRVSAADVRAMNSDILPVGDYAALIVEDEGTGIPPEVLGKIFEPFFTTKDVGKGTGLGLSTVYGIVKQSGGFIFADSDEGKGARFSVYLPVHDARGEAPVEDAPTRRTDDAPDPSWGTGHILLVEDEDMVRAVAERALTRQGYRVTSARDGEEGLDTLARHGPFDLVLSDVVMPTMDGPAMARAIRKAHPDLPVLFMSGYAEETLRKSIDIPNMHFLPKPFSVGEIVEAVGKALAKAGARAARKKK